MTYTVTPDQILNIRSAERHIIDTVRLFEAINIDVESLPVDSPFATFLRKGLKEWVDAYAFAGETQILSDAEIQKRLAIVDRMCINALKASDTAHVFIMEARQAVFNDYEKFR